MAGPWADPAGVRFAAGGGAVAVGRLCTGHADQGGGGLAAGLAGGSGLGGVGDGGEVEEGLAGLGHAVGGDGAVALGGEAADDAEAALRPVGVEPGFEVFERDLGVVADVEDGEGGVEEEAEEEAGMNG